MFKQTSIGKAFEINKNCKIYGTFAEIGAGQETVNFFYRAGMASQTVAKSMSAYDMTVSDEIYGKQNRYVCKDRLMNMLDHEYRLLEKRLKKKHGDQICFFTFASTAVTSSKKSNSIFSNNQHAWLGLRFQSKPKGEPNEVSFHVNCLDKNRLQQHEALGILGVNLIYAVFYHNKTPKQFIESLNENLSGSRLEIHAMSLSGPVFKNFSNSAVNLEILSQKLSSLAFFSKPESSEFLSDWTFNKNLVILYGMSSLFKNFEKARVLKSLNLKQKSVHFVSFLPRNKIHLSQFKKCPFPLITAQEHSMDELKKLISLYTVKPIVFVLDEQDFKQKLFDKKSYHSNSLLKALGDLFDYKTRVAVLSKDKSFSVKNYSLKKGSLLKDYLFKQKKLLDI